MFLQVGFVVPKAKKITEANTAYRYAANISEKARVVNEDDFRFTRLFLLSSVKMLNLNASNNNAEEYGQLLVLAENYCKRIPTRHTQQLLAEFYFELRCIDVRYLQTAYKIYETLCDKYPEFYRNNLWRFRNYMWNNKLLDESFFKRKYLEVISQEEDGFMCCIDPVTKTQYRFMLCFVSCKSLDKIQTITITDYKCKGLKGITVSYLQIDPPTNLLQICPIEMSVSNQIIIPDERVLLTYKNGKTVEYVFCYG